MTNQSLTTILGTSNIGPPLPTTPSHTWTDTESIKTLFSAWQELGGQRLDTAHGYGITKEYGPGGSERAIRDAGGVKHFMVDTKILGAEDGAHEGDKIRESLEASLSDLGVKKVNILYLHSPDRTTPFLHVLQQLDTLYREGKFTTLGLSNYTAHEVHEFYLLSRKHFLIKPKVYQGNYSALSRRGEKALFPVLRREGIAFYAWSPLAMGMLVGGPAKESQEAASALPPGSRFHPDSRKSDNFKGMWFKPEIFEAIKILNKMAKESDLTPTELSLRWIVHHSQLNPEFGDALVLGASTVQQLENTVSLLSKGPLNDSQVSTFDKMWELCKEVVPNYCN